MSTRSIFYGLPAYVGTMTGQTQCGFWPVDPATIDWNPALLISVNIAKNPQAVRNGLIGVSAIEADDYITNPTYPGMTSIGPMFPDGTTVGACYYQSAHYDALPPLIRPPRVPVGMLCHDYELETVWYWDGTLANRRFHGFYAQIVAEKGTQAQCSIYPAGKGLVPNQQPAGTWWLNLPTVAHPLETGFTTIWTGTGNPKIGALFLDHPTVMHLALDKPKLPPTQGADLF